MTQVRPVETLVARKLYGEDAAAILRHHLFYYFSLRSKNGRQKVQAYDTGKRVTTVLGPITLQELGHEFGCGEMRHIFAALGRAIDNPDEPTVSTWIEV
jgi:hypothetical protein